MAEYDINAYIDKLRAAGIDPRQFAAFVSQFVESAPTPLSTDRDNVPGFEYAQRVSTAALHAVLAHGEEANRAWSEMRRGRFGIGAAMQSWTKVVQNYADVVMEGLRLPTQGAQPAWLFIPYSKKKKPSPQFSIRIDTAREQAMSVESTNFESPGRVGSAAMSRPGTVQPSLYKKNPELVGGRIEFTLDSKSVEELENDTMHTAFVFRKGMGAASPVAIVVLHVSE